MRLARWSLTWAADGSPLITPMQALPFRLLLATWTVEGIAGDFAQVAVVDGSGTVLFAADAIISATPAAAQICFAVGQPRDNLADETFASPGYLPPDLWVMPNERVVLSHPSASAPLPQGANVMLTMGFPDVPEVTHKRLMPRDEAGKVRKSPRRRKKGK